MPTFVAIVRPLNPADDRQLVAAAQAALGLALDSAYDERRYLLSGPLDAAAAARIAGELLTDPLLDRTLVFPLDELQPSDAEADWAIDIAYRPGVTDNEGESVLLGARRAEIAGLEHVRTLRRVYLRGTLEYEQIEELAYELLANDLVEASLVSLPDDTGAATIFYGRLVEPPQPHAPRITTIGLRQAGDAELQRISRAGVLALDLAEMQAIRDYYVEIGRDPTDGELETLAQTWSEHCSHKTFKALIEYRETADGGLEIPSTIDGLLKTFFIAETRRIDPPWLLSAFVDNAGIMAFGDDDDFDQGRDPQPSFGAGAVRRRQHRRWRRDPRCAGRLGAADRQHRCAVLRPAGPAAPVAARRRAAPAAHRRRRGRRRARLWQQAGHPDRQRRGAVRSRLHANPLVFCGTVGLAPRGQHATGAQPGDAVVVLGGRTGRDGIHGATFSSEELTHETAETVGARCRSATRSPRRRCSTCCSRRATSACTARSPIAAPAGCPRRWARWANTGARVALDEVPLKYAGLQPWEIWLSEAQERMVLAVPPDRLDALLALCATRMSRRR